MSNENEPKFNETNFHANTHVDEIQNPSPVALNPLQPAPPSKLRDPTTLRVRGGDPNHAEPNRRPTDPSGLSRSILHVLSEHEYVKIESVGPVAMNVVMAAFRMACEVAESRDSGVVLVMRQSKYTAEIGGKKADGVRSRVFAIPIKFAV